MVEVTKEAFFTALKSDARNIMPMITGPFPYKSVWRTPAGTIFGESVDTVGRGGIATSYFSMERYVNIVERGE